VITEHRHDDLAGVRRVDRPPLDVEIPGVGGRLAVLEDVHPPGVVGAHDAHVIRHHVQDLAHAVRPERRDEAVEVVAVADLRVERGVVDDVVAVPAAGARAQVGRTVHVAHAEPREVRH
jgi:hypothetical protein